jgi:predicted Holliday junction resolvase-like endonuclease
MSLNNLLFLSQGVQVAVFLLFIALIMVFMKVAKLEQRLKNTEDHLIHYITKEDYFETFNNMWEEKAQGGDLGYVEEEAEEKEQWEAASSSRQDY